MHPDTGFDDVFEMVAAEEGVSVEAVRAEIARDAGRHEQQRPGGSGALAQHEEGGGNAHAGRNVLLPAPAYGGCIRKRALLAKRPLFAV